MLWPLVTISATADGLQIQIDATTTDALPDGARFLGGAPAPAAAWGQAPTLKIATFNVGGTVYESEGHAEWPRIAAQLFQQLVEQAS